MNESEINDCIDCIDNQYFSRMEMAYQQGGLYVEHGNVIYIDETIFEEDYVQELERTVFRKPTQKSFRCVPCGATFSSKEAIEQHFITNRSNPSDSEDNQGSSDEDNAPGISGEHEGLNIKNECEGREDADSSMDSETSFNHDQDNEDHESVTASPEVSSEHGRLNMKIECDEGIASVPSVHACIDKSDNQDQENATKGILMDITLKDDPKDDAYQLQERPYALSNSMSPDSGVDVEVMTDRDDHYHIENSPFLSKSSSVKSESEQSSESSQIFQEDTNDSMPCLSPQTLLPDTENDQESWEEMVVDDDRSSDSSAPNEENKVLDASLDWEEDEDDGIFLYAAHYAMTKENERLIWCKKCDMYWKGIEDLRNHITKEHKIDASRVTSKNYATYDLEIGRSLEPPPEEELMEGD